jgi:hypothetical protein
VIVHDPVEPVRVFLSDAAVLHGTPESACAATFDGDLVKAALAPGNARERALVNLDGPSWLFRTVSDNTRRDTRVEYRTMLCHPDVSAELPAEIYEMPGTASDG